MLKFSDQDIEKSSSTLEWIRSNLPGGRLPPIPTKEVLRQIHSLLGATLVRKIESAGSKVNLHSMQAVVKNRVCAVCGDRICHSNGFECTVCWGTLEAGQKKELRADAIRAGFLAKYGRTNVFAGPEGVKMVRKATRRKYGVSNVMGVAEMRERASRWWSDEEKVKQAADRCKETNLKKLGVTHWTKSESRMKRFRKDLVSKTGVDNVMKITKVRKKWQKAMSARDHQAVFQKASNTLFERTGFTNAFLDVEHIKKKRFEKTGCIGPWGKETKRKYKEKTGFDYPFQNPEILEKALSKAKSSSLKRDTKELDTSKLRGNPRSVLGYEPMVINDLSESKSVDALLIGSEVDGIPYTDSTRKRRTYHPDMVVVAKSGDWVIEVKSTYTLSQDMDRNLRKFRAARRASGDRFILAVVSRDKIFYIRDFQRLARWVRKAEAKVLEKDLIKCSYKISSSVSVKENAGTNTIAPPRKTRTSS